MEKKNQSIHPMQSANELCGTDEKYQNVKKLNSLNFDQNLVFLYNSKLGSEASSIVF